MTYVPEIAGLCLVAILSSGCKCSEGSGTRASSSEAPSATSPTKSSAAAPAASIPPRRGFPVPSGPRLAILHGQGVGPIRLGATVATIERHMQAPCDVRDEKLCRYIARAVDFHLEDGVTQSITVHRRDRQAGKDKRSVSRDFGVFNGAIPPDLQPGMVPGAIQEYLGPPEKTEKAPKASAHGTEEFHHYPGLVLEYDRLENGNLVVGAIKIVDDPRVKPGDPPLSSARMAEKRAQRKSEVVH